MAKRHAHHGGAWKVAYADFVTAMMALFLVLWLTSQDEKIKEAVERAFRQPYAIGKEGPTSMIPKEGKDVGSSNKGTGSFQNASAMELAMLRKLNEDLLRSLKSETDDPNNHTVELQLNPEGLRISVFDRASKPVFEPDQDKLTPYGQWVFSTLAWEISRYHSFAVELEGHTERTDTPIGEDDHKWELSANRANATRRMLLKHGVASGQVRKVAGFADTLPMANHPPESEVNRRVAVLLRVNPENGSHAQL